MLIPSLPHMHYFHFSYTCYLGSNDSTKFLESNVIFDSFLEGHFGTSSRNLCGTWTTFFTSKNCKIFYFEDQNIENIFLFHFVHS
jgi:hypothetical protein